MLWQTALGVGRMQRHGITKTGTGALLKDFAGELRICARNAKELTVWPRNARRRSAASRDAAKECSPRRKPWVWNRKKHKPQGGERTVLTHWRNISHVRHSRRCVRQPAVGLRGICATILVEGEGFRTGK